jgi:multidrug resistance efflux pump
VSEPQGSKAAGEAKIENCTVDLIEEERVPGREPGALEALEVKEGQTVKKGQVLARIDDSEPAALKRVKEFEHQAAKQKSEDDVEIRFSKKAAEEAGAEWQKAEEANATKKRSVSDVEVLRLKLAHEKAKLGTEKAIFEQGLAKVTCKAKEAEVAAADLSIKRRLIKSSLDGVVVQTFHHVGEWVPAGDAVVHVVRIDRLYIKGFLNVSQFGPAEIDKHAVTVEVPLARDRRAKFPGKIVFVSPLVKLGGDYEVWAVVENRKEGDRWVLSPGLDATMTIHLK